MGMAGRLERSKSDGSVDTNITTRIVDIGPNFSHLDGLIQESQTFLAQMAQIRDHPSEDEGSGVLQAAKKFRQWRSRRRDEKLLLTMNSLLPRIKACEEHLRDLIIQIVEKKLALRDQAKHLKSRLDACISYNAEYIDDQDDTIESMRNTVNSLSTESTLVKAMVAFNVELVRQKVMETVRNNRTFVSWGSKAVLLRPISEQELSEDADHPELMRRLNAIRECREQFVLKLSSILEIREGHLVNLQNCTKAHKCLVDLISANGEEFGVNDSTSFNHEHCHDCSYVQSISMDCVNHLQDLTRQTAEASQRLLQLVELREKVRDSAEFLHLEDELVYSDGDAATLDMATINLSDTHTSPDTVSSISGESREGSESVQRTADTVIAGSSTEKGVSVSHSISGDTS